MLIRVRWIGFGLDGWMVGCAWSLGRYLGGFSIHHDGAAIDLRLLLAFTFHGWEQNNKIKRDVEMSVLLAWYGSWTSRIGWDGTWIGLGFGLGVGMGYEMDFPYTYLVT